MNIIGTTKETIIFHR